MLLNEDGCQFVLVSQFELSRLVTEELELLALEFVEIGTRRTVSELQT